MLNQLLFEAIQVLELKLLQYVETDWWPYKNQSADSSEGASRSLAVDQNAYCYQYDRP